MRKLRFTLLFIFFISASYYAQDTTSSQSAGKFFLSGVVGVPLIFKGIEISFDANYMFTKKWGISLGYYGGFYDSTGSTLAHWNAMIRCKSVFPLQSLSNVNLSTNLDITPNNISIYFTQPFSIDTGYSSSVLTTPSGKYFSSSIPDKQFTTLKFKYDGVGKYRFTLSLYSKDSFEVFDTTVVFYFSPTEVYAVGNNYPNPFNGTTMVPVTLYENSGITMQIYNILGQLLLEKNMGVKQSGVYIIPVNISNFASSVYFLRLIFTNSSGRTVEVARKLAIIK